jgi:hypothetical protein
MIEGDIKLTGKELFLDQYKKEKRTPDNFKIQDETGSSCLFIVMDKYTSVDDDKAELLRNYDGLLGKMWYTNSIPNSLKSMAQFLSDLITSSPTLKNKTKVT